MKKIQTLILVLISLALNAQNNPGDKVVSINAGFSWTGFIFNTLTADDININLENTDASVGSFSAAASPAVGLTFDYGITEVFSLGGLYAQQSFTGDIENYSWKDINGVQQTESLSFDASRNNISLVPRFHFRMKSEQVDLYSGFKIGFNFWRLNVDAQDRDFSALDKLTPSRPSFGLIPIGARFNIAENFGLNVETGVGAPYVFSIGAQYKFQ